MDKNSKLVAKGFTLIELMIVIAILAILAAIAIPEYIHFRQKAEVAEALSIAKELKQKIGLYYANELKFPGSNGDIGLGAPASLSLNRVKAVEIDEGAIHVTLGNQVSTPLQDKVISLRPAVFSGAAIAMTWHCGNSAVSANASVGGENRTSVDSVLLPAVCQDLSGDE